MRKILSITLIMIAACLTANAQGTGAITISNVKADIEGETIELALDIKASGLEIKCGGELTLEFAIETDKDRVILPVVVYSGGLRYRYEQRRDLLSDGFTVEPYATYKGVKKNRTYETEYRLTIPYYTWMVHASIAWREYTHDCSGDRVTANGLIVADLNPAPVYVEPEIWSPNSSLFPNLVRFLVPEVEEVKARASMIELRIGFPVNVTEVRPAFENNAFELARADSLVTLLNSNELIDIRGVNIHGYASPEGSYSNNERLARGRSESFKQYLVRNYPDNEYVRNATTMWTPEDWEGFGRMVEACDNVALKHDVLAIVNDGSIAPDTKDRMLQQVVWWSQNYKVILKEMYPQLRRIELKVDYTIQKLSDSQARELLYTHPEMLSLDEMFRVAKYHKPGNDQYREVYEIAARQYPNDIIANNNAAAAFLQEGKAQEALPHLEKTKGDDNSLINYGAYYYITGDLDKAMEYFTRAKEAGIEQADQNLRLANPAQYK